MLDNFEDTRGYDAALISKQLTSLTGKNVQYHFASDNVVMIKWSGKWVDFDTYNSIFNVLED